MYGDKRDYRKIDIFVAHTHQGERYFAYKCSTTWAKTCREAMARFIVANPLAYQSKDVRARFSR